MLLQKGSKFESLDVSENPGYRLLHGIVKKAVALYHVPGTQYN